ncbi:cyclic GMP-AMP synthase-like receptor isoform X2 [Parasteatoda tepidariorum]|nr:cyclic GMP-AMP synthase isoform X2 [Parasteatoda tepidariorum]XP_015925565.1 cyclic GMP-AMP synthase isoform X2 [Parasteatoda tepidariorum]
MPDKKVEVVQAQKFKKPGVSILKEILRRIKLNDALIKENNQILHDFLNTFVAKMKEEDELFKFLYRELYFTGSFYSDLRVSMPDEFDINMILKLPFNDSEFEVIHQPQAPSFVKYRLKNHQAALLKHPRLASSLFEDGYLIPESVRKWLQSVVDKALRSYTPPRSCMQVCTKQSGPARTILLKKRNGGQIDVDLVPVVSCSLILPRTYLDGRVEAKVGKTLKAFLVPKPYSSSAKQMPINRQEAKCLWRSHFPDPEEKIIYNVGCVKPIIKLLKLLRDKEDWKILASYYLKTVVMWMVLESNGKQDYWKEDKMEERFLEALQKLDAAVSQRKITYMFNKKYNLLEKLNEQQATNIHNRLAFFIRNIKDDPKRLWSFFKEKPAFLNS